MRYVQLFNRLVYRSSPSIGQTSIVMQCKAEHEQQTLSILMKKFRTITVKEQFTRVKVIYASINYKQRKRTYTCVKVFTSVCSSGGTHLNQPAALDSNIKMILSLGHRQMFRIHFHSFRIVDALQIQGRHYVLNQGKKMLKAHRVESNP